MLFNLVPCTLPVELVPFTGPTPLPPGNDSHHCLIIIRCMASSLFADTPFWSYKAQSNLCCRNLSSHCLPLLALHPSSLCCHLCIICHTCWKLKHMSHHLHAEDVQLSTQKGKPVSLSLSPTSAPPQGRGGDSTICPPPPARYHSF